MSDYYHYYNQKYDLPKPTEATNLTSAKSVLEAYQNGIRVFKNITIENESFFGEDLSEITFENSRLYADFRNADLKNATFINGYVKTCDFRFANLTNARFENLNVEDTQFKGATIIDFVFKNNCAYGANNLQQKDFERLFLKPIPKGKVYLEDI